MRCSLYSILNAQTQVKVSVGHKFIGVAAFAFYGIDRAILWCGRYVQPRSVAQYFGRFASEHHLGLEPAKTIVYYIVGYLIFEKTRIEIFWSDAFFFSAIGYQSWRSQSDPLAAGEITKHSASSRRQSIRIDSGCRRKIMQILIIRTGAAGENPQRSVKYIIPCSQQWRAVH